MPDYFWCWKWTTAGAAKHWNPSLKMELTLLLLLVLLCALVCLLPSRWTFTDPRLNGFCLIRMVNCWRQNCYRRQWRFKKKCPKIWNLFAWVRRPQLYEHYGISLRGISRAVVQELPKKSGERWQHPYHAAGLYDAQNPPPYHERKNTRNGTGHTHRNTVFKNEILDFTQPTHLRQQCGGARPPLRATMAAVPKTWVGPMRYAGGASLQRAGSSYPGKIMHACWPNATVYWNAFMKNKLDKTTYELALAEPLPERPLPLPQWRLTY